MNITDADLNRIFPMRRIDRVLLVNPPDVDASMFDYDKAARGRYENYPAYGLGILATKLREIGVEVEILNLNHEILKSVAEDGDVHLYTYDELWQAFLDDAINGLGPDLIGISCMFTMSHQSFKDVCQYAKAHWDIPVAVGGVHVTGIADSIRDEIPEIDFVFEGEGEITFTDAILFISRYISRLPGHYLIPHDFSTIPAYDLMPMTEHAKYGLIGSFSHMHRGEPRCATVLTNRGCRGSCTFCAVGSFSGRGVRQRSVESVITELKILRDEYAIGHIMFLDDDLFYNEERAVALFDAMTEARLGMTWDATNGVLAASCTGEVISAAARSGCVGLHIGIESGNPEILRSIRKPATVDTFMEAAEVLRQYPTIYTSGFLMIGFPGETMGQIRDTMSLAQKMNLDWYTTGILQALAGAPMVKDGTIKLDDESRYEMGGHGKGISDAIDHPEITNISDETIPDDDQLGLIWLYMDAELNYKQLAYERRPLKIYQQKAQLEKITTILYPGHKEATEALKNMKGLLNDSNL